jgi:hypothetical protein
MAKTKSREPTYTSLLSKAQAKAAQKLLRDGVGVALKEQIEKTAEAIVRSYIKENKSTIEAEVRKVLKHDLLKHAKAHAAKTAKEAKYWLEVDY